MTAPTPPPDKIGSSVESAAAFAQAFPYASDRANCPCGPHRGPQGPNEDMAQCPLCLSMSHSQRPSGETYGEHLPDCSLPVDHESYCQPGGSGHPVAQHVRGYFPEGTLS